MEHLSRSETKLILEGLDSVRERMRLDTSIDLRDDPDYRSLLKLQVKLIEHLENLPF
jgi:hypothetical protein